MSDATVTMGDTEITDRQSLFRKIAWRILPVLFCSYCVAFLDRVNVGFTQLQMGKSLNIGPTQYGFAAGIFFLSYALLEVPSNMLFRRIGARRSFLRIMLLWGLAVTLTGFISSTTQFYIMRVLLGVFEAGFFPGMILYLTYWFPSSHRGRVTSIMFLANAVASTIAGPLTGGIMTWLDGANGWEGWRWAFLLEGPPAILMGVLCYCCLADRPDQAGWLSPGERNLLQSALNEDEAALRTDGRASLFDVLSDPAVYLLSLLYFVPTCANYLLNFWLPTILRESGEKAILNIGLLTMIPMLCGCIGTIVVNFSSDYFRERRWHFVVCLALAAAGFVASTWQHDSITATIITFGVIGFGVGAIGPLFWTLPPTYFTRASSPIGIAIISTLGITAGFISPWFVGLVRSQTGSFDIGIYVVAELMALCIPLLLFVVPARSLRVGS